MRVAVIGSRNLRIDDLEKYLPENTTEIVSGGASVLRQHYRSDSRGTQADSENEKFHSECSETGRDHRVR